MNFRGVAPTLLLEQVRNTASWALEGPTEGPGNSWRAALLAAAETPQAYEPSWRYLRLLLAAHFATLTTFVPTDVDSHIRHHAWRAAEDPESLRAAVDVVDEASRWDVRAVSARYVTVRGVGVVSGYEGEWFSVRAGALGRALSLGEGAHDVVDRLVAAIDEELERQALAFEKVSGAPGRELDALRVAVTVAHNLGDLSRVVEEWTSKSPEAGVLRRRYARLGHPDAAKPDPRFRRVGRLNLEVMAQENHRYLPLRAARPLRLARELLLPIGPCFDAWGEAVARHPALDQDAPGGALGGRASVVAALLEGHLLGPTLQGYLRALSGLHRAHPGGLERLAGDVPARLRRHLTSGPVREALRLDPARFEARLVNRYRAVV